MGARLLLSLSARLILRFLFVLEFHHVELVLLLGLAAGGQGQVLTVCGRRRTSSRKILDLAAEVLNSGRELLSGRSEQGLVSTVGGVAEAGHALLVLK